MFRMCTYMHKIILIKEYFINNFYFIYYIYRTRCIFRCYGKRPSLICVRVRSTIVLDPLSGAMVNGRTWFASALDPLSGVMVNGRGWSRQCIHNMDLARTQTNLTINHSTESGSGYVVPPAQKWI